MLRPKRKFQGFTLIELMLVVAIIALLAGLTIPNMLRSRMAANEAAAVAACRQYVTAQAQYLRTDWDNDGTREYAQNTAGPRGLYTNNPALPGDAALVDMSFSRAVGNPGAAIPKSGYVFSILTSQGSNAPNGASSYLVNGHLTVGYALSAIPLSWDVTGRNTFQVNQTGTVYQKDRGGSASASHLPDYDPDNTWTIVQ
jgi:prepilin-type N-terminal cleavage/methylation domain-containing protein